MGSCLAKECGELDGAVKARQCGARNIVEPWFGVESNAYKKGFYPLPDIISCFSTWDQETVDEKNLRKEF